MQKVVPNQRIIKVKKAKADKDNLYGILNKKCVEMASSALDTKAGFKLYIYCAMNVNDYTFALSREHFMRYANCAESAYRSAVKELIDKGYLVEQEKKDNFIFYEWGHNAEERDAAKSGLSLSF